MNCWEKLHRGIADEIDKDMCLARTAGAMQEIDNTCSGFAEKVDSLIKEYQEELQFAEFNIIFFVTDKRTKDTDQPLIQCVYGTKGELQKLCVRAKEAIK